MVPSCVSQPHSAEVMTVLLNFRNTGLFEALSLQDGLPEESILKTEQKSRSVNLLTSAFAATAEHVKLLWILSEPPK
jgi:hypothetical protein